MSDRRSQTSRANLEAHIPERIDPDDETVILTVRMPRRLHHELVRHAEHFGISRSQAARDFLTWALDQASPLGDQW